MPKFQPHFDSLENRVAMNSDVPLEPYLVTPTPSYSAGSYSTLDSTSPDYYNQPISPSQDFVSPNYDYQGSLSGTPVVDQEYINNSGETP